MSKKTHSSNVVNNSVNKYVPVIMYYCSIACMRYEYIHVLWWYNELKTVNTKLS